MTSINLYNQSGVKQKAIKVDDKIFAVKTNDALIAQAIKVYLSNQRQPNAQTKARGEVKVTKKKVWRQKGTGRARHGSRNAPIFVGGAKAHGPTGQQNFKLKLTQKQKQLSLFATLTKKLKEDKIIAVKGLEKLEPKTKKFGLLYQKLNKTAKKTLILLEKDVSSIVRGTKNLKTVKSIEATNLNTYQALNSDQIIFTENSLKIFQDHYLKKN